MRLVDIPGVLVATTRNFPPQNLSELLAYAREHPGKVNYGSAGVGTVSHVAGEYFANTAGIKITHIPYKGTAPALTDVLGGQVDLMFISLVTGTTQVRAGRLRAYGVTSAERALSAPEIPTLAEAGLPDFEALQWFGLAAPAHALDVVGDVHATAHFMGDGS